jgi:hypothetical protein
MGRQPRTFTVEMPIPAAQAAPSLANVVPFNRRGRPFAKFEPIPSTRSSRSTSGWNGPKGVIIDFAHADPGTHAAKGHSCRSNENEAGLTAADYAAIAYIVMSVAFYPALAWLFSS